MTYKVFKETLLEELAGYFPPDTHISIHTIPKNNNISLEGLTILEEGYNIAPTIYIQEYYEQLQQGAEFLTVLKQILDTYYEYRPTENIDTSMFLDFELIQQQIVFKLIHYERNQNLLKDIPFVPFLDLAIVFYCLVATSTSGTATILIQNSHLRLWNTDITQIYALAKKNTSKLLPPHFEMLSNMLSNILPSSQEQIPLLDDLTFPIYILTNNQRFLGASCILYDDLISQLAQKLECDFYIIPSSIHEVLLIPSSIDMSQETFHEMICEVNETQLEPQDILSDHLYFYSREKNVISI